MNGTCYCDNGYSGNLCQIASCPNECNYKGSCDYGVCKCQAGYKGDDCAEKYCQNECSGHGICTDS